MKLRCVPAVTLIILCPHFVWAQATAPATTKPPSTTKEPAPSTGKPTASTAAPAPATQPAGQVAPSDYRIGAEDVLGVVFWREMEMSGDVSVRPDGMITVPLLGDVRAIGLSTDQLKDLLQKNASKFLADPNVTVVVRQINSRKFFVTGQVHQSGAFALIQPRNVMQAIAMAGGLSE